MAFQFFLFGSVSTLKDGENLIVYCIIVCTSLDRLGKPLITQAVVSNIVIHCTKKCAGMETIGIE